MSGDGRFATFVSAHAGFVASDTNGRFDVFRRDLVGGATARISLSAAGAQLGHNSFGGAMTGDGGDVVFWAGDGVTAGDTNSAPDVFLRGPFP
jgi:Tol biopolymer transport system component